MIPDKQTGHAEVNGTRLYYELEGEGQPLVLIHGFGTNTSLWDPQLPALVPNCRVLRYDMRGFGQSAPESGPHRSAEDLAALLDHLNLPAAHLAGLSLGGQVAIHFAIQFPERTLSVTAADAMVRGVATMEQFSASLKALWQTANSEGIDAAKVLWTRHPLFEPALRDPALAQRITEMLAPYDGYHWLHGDTQIPLEPPAAERLHEITAPTLVLVGELDLPEFLDMSDALAQRIPRARKVVLRGTGHVSNMEAPIAFNTAVLDFLGDVGAI